jgi:hypothetical protein
VPVRPYIRRRTGVYISLPDQSSVDEVAKEIAQALASMITSGVTFVRDVRFEMRAFTADGHEFFGTDAKGEPMGFTVRRSRIPGERVIWSIRSDPPRANRKPAVAAKSRARSASLSDSDETHA